MNILWVEDFDNGKGARVALTRQWLNAILCARVKGNLTTLEENGSSDSISFLSTLAANDSPIVWADSFASALAALEMGTAAYSGNKYSQIPRVKGPYEVALLDLAIPFEKEGGQLRESYSANARNLLDAEEKNNTFDLQDPGLKAFPGIILAMRLMQRGMPAERIFFLTANADVSGMPASIKSIVGPELLKKNIIAKTKIEDLLKYIENDAYYQLKTLICSISEEVLSFIKQAEFIGATQSEFDFKNQTSTNSADDVGDEAFFLFEEKKETLSYLKEFMKILPTYLGKDDRKIYYTTIVNKILTEFANVKITTMLTEFDETYAESIPARFYITNLKYLRNINAHTSYLKNVTECEVCIVFSIFIGYILEVYRIKNNELHNFDNITSKLNNFFNNETILNGKSNSSHQSDADFMNNIASKYMDIVKRNSESSSTQQDAWFANITAKLPDGLNLKAWDVLRLTFWSQVSYTSASRHNFHNAVHTLRKRQLFNVLGDRLALSEK